MITCFCCYSDDKGNQIEEIHFDAADMKNDVKLELARLQKRYGSDLLAHQVKPSKDGCVLEVTLRSSYHD